MGLVLEIEMIGAWAQILLIRALEWAQKKKKKPRLRSHRACLVLYPSKTGRGLKKNRVVLHLAFENKSQEL